MVTIDGSYSGSYFVSLDRLLDQHGLLGRLESRFREFVVLMDSLSLSPAASAAAAAAGDGVEKRR